MTIYILDPVHPKVVDMAKEKYNVVTVPESRTGDWRLEADAIIVRTHVVNGEDIESAKKLKIIAKHGVGVDNIDYEAARRKGILVTNTPGANSITVAEYVVALTLALCRNLCIYSNDLRAGKWRAQPTAFELNGKTIGLVGLGEVGRRVAKMFSQGFGASVSAYDPYASEKIFNDHNVQRITGLSDLLSMSDVVSLHVPLTPTTKGMIGIQELRLMKPQAVLINVARGGIVNEADLYTALKEKIIFAAASDVFLEEPVNENHPLLQLENFMASPHVAGTSDESLIRMGMDALENIEAQFSGKTPRNIV
ncbi:hydroxyacid dehydrogenase [Flavisolibacter ginsenosidimutans]|uniref:Hydroxyacid dehydrogenase n=1 Tax=Flavisolibacter ginsenosidimutans TaxID=661481 RepID=A0A5B8UFX0_9BACT|nr:hydroxyacid dehydrogenase [Flavisolibacter ginsenosidimutans]QEC55322.1 hydroxyacid dehydrogenase [Flavisolibacter ginsenosidimutans]